MGNHMSLWAFLAFCMITTTQSRDSITTWQRRNHPHLVTHLPGQPKVGFNHYAGYVNLNEKSGRALFYWFFEAPTLKERKPLVLWLNGGPGCSSVGYGASEEIGPFLVEENGTGLHLNGYAWNKQANLLFVESPVGVGFSYSNKTSDYKKLGDKVTAENSYVFLQKWFELYPQYRTRKFYLTGESYAGHYVPELAELIHDRNKIHPKSHYINLKGFMVGNPTTDFANDYRGFTDYAWSHAIVSDETHIIIQENCDFDANNTFDNEKCLDAVDEVFAQYDKIDMYSLYTPTCIHKNTTKSLKRRGSTQFKYSSHKFFMHLMRGPAGGYDPCHDQRARPYYNRYDVQKALHVLNGSQLRNWTICNNDLFNDWTDNLPTVLPIYHKLLKAGYRIWVYSGDTDGRVPVLSTRYSLNALKLLKGPWRPWYFQEQVAGWSQDYGALTFATIKGAGHEAPLFKRGQSFLLYSSFLSGRALPNQTQS